METPIQTVRGMHDILPEKSAEYLQVEMTAREIFSLFGYREIRTPLLEPLALFERALGAATDVVEKEMFTLKDRGDRTLCLRPEGTAGVVRALIENGLIKKYPVLKLFYMGPMFRAERPQKGRYREFVQIGSEYFAVESPSADAETIRLAIEILNAVGLKGIELRLNSIGCAACRPLYQNLLLNFFEKQAVQFCHNCQNRIKKNPLRLLDCKEDSDKLQTAPNPQEVLCDSCSGHFNRVQKLLRSTQTPFNVAPHLVRGLDYYTRTVFEIFPAGQTASQDALGAGGRYDTLVEDLGGNKIPAVGFALGVDRILNLLREQQVTEGTSLLKKEQPHAPYGQKENGIFVAAIGEEPIEKSFQIATQLRTHGWNVDAVLNNQSLKSQMRLADSLGMRFCVIIGENELKENVVTLRDLKSQSQEKVPMHELLNHLNSSGR